MLRLGRTSVLTALGLLCIGSCTELTSIDWDDIPVVGDSADASVDARDSSADSNADSSDAASETAGGSAGDASDGAAADANIVGSGGTNGSSGSAGTGAAAGSAGISGRGGSSGTSGRGGNTGTGGTNGAGGTNGTNGASGTNGTNGASGDAGSGASADSGGTAGTGGTAGDDAGLDGATGGTEGEDGGPDGSLGSGGSSDGAADGSDASLKCGNGTADPGEICDDPFTVNDCGADCSRITSAACMACESGTPCATMTDCRAVQGNAPDGTPRSQLCNEALDCIRDSACAAGSAPPIDCYCGNVGFSRCDNGQGNGACREVLERALESTHPAEIRNRIFETAYAGGFAARRISCDKTHCSAQCFMPRALSTTRPSNCGWSTGSSRQGVQSMLVPSADRRRKTGLNRNSRTFSYETPFAVERRTNCPTALRLRWVTKALTRRRPRTG
jgi:hypothetical protein